jgi:glycolate oxidase FAD binding subunit
MAAASRPAGADDAVDGVQPEVVVEPASVEEAGEVLREATAEGRRVVCRGGGSKLGWGNPPSAAEVILGTGRLDRVLEYAQGDLVVKVEAGVRLDDLRKRLLDEGGQQLSLDPFDGPAATIGGIVAANASGPWRHRYRTVRDLLIGITVVLSDGSVAHAGGKVVKNVAGYDLGKLFTGSLGTLGLIAEATFRLHPALEGQGLTGVTLRTPDPETAGAAAQELAHSQLDPSMLELRWPDPGGPGRLVLVVQGPTSISRQAEAAVRLLEPYGAAEPIGADNAGEVIAGLHHYPWHGADGAVLGVKAACVPTELPGAIRDLWEAARAGGLEVSLQAHAAVAVAHAALRGDPAALVSAVEETRGLLARRGGSLVVLEAPLEVKRQVDIWGPAGDALPLMRRVKERFDPAGTMSPGRFVGGI